MESIEDSMVKLDSTIVRRMYRLSRKDNMVKLDRTSLEHVYKLTFKQNNTVYPLGSILET